MNISDYAGPERRKQESEKWHIKKEFQLGHLITTVTVAISCIVYVQHLEQRIALVEQAIVEQHVRDKTQDDRVTEAITNLRADMKEIGGKLDRLIERR